MKVLNSKYWLLLILWLTVGFVWGQDINKPYSAIGIGELEHPGFVPNMGMGGIGIGMPNNANYSIVNPSLSVFDSVFTSFEAGVIGVTKTLIKDSAASQGMGGNPRYFALGFPIINSKWSGGFGLMQFSEINFTKRSTTFLSEDIFAVKTAQGNGGISDAFITQGLRVFDRQLMGSKDTLRHTFNLGGKMSFLFGSTSLDNFTETYDSIRPSYYQVALTDANIYSGLRFSGSGSYTLIIPAKKENESPALITLGAVYDFGSNIGTTSTRVFQKWIDGEPRPDYPGDTTLENDGEETRGQTYIPAGFGVGFSYKRPYKFSIGADFYYQDWAQLTYIDGSTDSLLAPMWRAAVGIEFTPDAQSVNSYFSRSTYRFGTFFEKSPYQLGQEEIYDVGITLGGSFPIRSYSSINLALMFGINGTTDNGLVQEQYLKIHFGVTFNDLWFKKYRYE